ncbi:MAG: triose-phosphate isomerase [Chlamydiia bacterium]|nr:triose-phosphate isomerase [Chlamydiia bacterium]
MAKRRQIIAGNWKMYKTIPEALRFIEELGPKASDLPLSVYLAVPYTAISEAARAAEGKKILIGAQNMNDASEGAFTGEIAARMLTDAGARFVLLGHSERRHIFGETDAMIHLKLLRALESGIEPILCVGETKPEREASKQFAVVEEQLKTALAEVKDLKKIVIAYEPVWAIGTGVTASPADAQEMHRHIRSILEGMGGGDISILYGGSVKPENAAALMSQSDVDGLLVGGASLSIEMFVEIVASATMSDLKTEGKS